MQLESELLDDHILRIALDGRMDIQGTQEIDMKFTALTATKRSGILVDMSRLEFIASIGIRTLLSCAKASSARGGRMVLYRPQPMVREVLDTSGVTALIPTYDDLEAAKETLRDSAGR